MDDVRRDRDCTGSTLPTVYAGRYAVEEKLGRGGMGRVLRARDLKLGRAVALKVLAPGAHEARQFRRFEQEARAAGSLNHPNIITVFDAGEDRGEPYIVTELLQGATLRALLHEGPLAPEKAAALALQLAEGSPLRTRRASFTAI
jgi:serine/threonine protein kinase